MAPVLFVNMPLAAIERPTIALGILKAILAGAGQPCDVAYANMWYAEYVGLDRIDLLDSTRPQDGLGDWLFGAAAFPGFDADDEGYAAWMVRRHPALATGGLGVEGLLALKRSSSAFLDDAVARVLARRPRIVGCTSMFQQHVASLALLRRVKQANPGIVTMLGGANCETTMGVTTHRYFPWVDYVVSGEADAFIAPLIGDVLRHGADLSAEQVPFGVFAPCHRAGGYPETRDGDGVPRAILDDIRDVPVPDYSDYFAELDQCLYQRNVFPSVPIETSRGCWWGAKSHCTFCGLNGGNMNFRAKPPQQAMADIETLVARHGVTRIQAVDNILDNGYMTELLPALAARAQPLSLFYEVKANLKRHQVEALARAGVRHLQPGIESLDTRVLKLMRKGTGAWQNIQLLKWSRQYGVGLSWSIIHSFPDEEDAWHAECATLMPFLHHLQPGGIGKLRYDRYSPYFRDPQRWRLRLRAARSYRHLYPLDAAALDEIAYFMDDIGPRVAEDTTERPGLIALMTAHAAWCEANKAAGPPLWKMPVLSMRRTADGGGVVTDTRACAIVQEAAVDTLDVILLDHADQAPTAERLIDAAVRASGHGADEVAARIARLQALGHILAVDGRLLGLVLDEPVALRPRLRDRPNGFVRPMREMQRMEKIFALAADEAA